MLTTNLGQKRQFPSSVAFCSSSVIKAVVWRSIPPRPRLDEGAALQMMQMISCCCKGSRLCSEFSLIQGERERRRRSNPGEHGLKAVSGVARRGQMIWLKGWWWVVIKGQLLAVTAEDGSSLPQRRTLQPSRGAVMRGVWRRWFSSQHYKRSSRVVFDQHSNNFFLLPRSGVNLRLVSCSFFFI